MSTLLNQTVLLHFPVYNVYYNSHRIMYTIMKLLLIVHFVLLEIFQGEEKNCGRIGLTIVVCGMFGSILFGAILDKTHKFK
jgi:FLVCR family feline leukemia virus subgroup C receptor-related protein